MSLLISRNEKEQLVIKLARGKDNKGNCKTGPCFSKKKNCMV